MEVLKFKQNTNTAEGSILSNFMKFSKLKQIFSWDLNWAGLVTNNGKKEL